MKALHSNKRRIAIQYNLSSDLDEFHRSLVEMASGEKADNPDIEDINNFLNDLYLFLEEN